MRKIRKNLRESKKCLHEGMSDYSSLISDVAESVRDRAERGDDIYDIIYEEMDRALIYYDDQWAILEAHFNPADCDVFMDAWDLTAQDIYDEVGDIFEDEEDEDYDESYKPVRKARAVRESKPVRRLRRNR